MAWGWSLKYPGQSAAQQALPLPPPTTLIGALSKSIVSLKGEGGEVLKEGSKYYSKASDALKYVSYVTCGVPNGKIVTYMDMSRNLSAPYLRRTHRRDMERWFAVQAMGRSFCVGGKLLIAYVIKQDADDELVYKAASILSRIGSKESIVSVDSIKMFDIRLNKHEGHVDTCFYVPEEVVETPLKDYEYINFWDFKDPRSYELGGEKPRELRYLVPKGLLQYGGSMELVPRENAVFVDALGQTILVPREVV